MATGEASLVDDQGVVKWMPDGHTCKFSIEELRKYLDIDILTDLLSDVWWTDWTRPSRPWNNF